MAQTLFVIEIELKLETKFNNISLIFTFDIISIDKSVNRSAVRCMLELISIEKKQPILSTMIQSTHITYRVVQKNVYDVI